MNVQIFGTKKCNDTKKAERFFKERGIKFQFIDMKEKEHREELMHILRMDLKKDKVPATLVDITRLGLVELTRKKVQKSLKEQLQGDVSDEK